jgi:predicted metal-binding membrane protein
MFCPQCGAPNDDDSIYCANCGAVLDPDAEPLEASEKQSGETAPADEPGASPVDAVPDVTSEEKPAAYEPPARYGAPAPSVPTSGVAVAALVLGISGLTVLPFLGSVLALIFGYMARNQIRRRPEALRGEGLAVAGIVAGWIGVGLTVLGIVTVGGVFLCGLCSVFGANAGY